MIDVPNLVGDPDEAQRDLRAVGTTVTCQFGESQRRCDRSETRIPADLLSHSKDNP